MSASTWTLFESEIRLKRFKRLSFLRTAAANFRLEQRIVTSSAAVSASRWQTRRMAPSGSANPVNIYPQHSTERGKARQYATPASLLEMREHREETRVALFKHDRVNGVLKKSRQIASGLKV